MYHCRKEVRQVELSFVARYGSFYGTNILSQNDTRFPVSKKLANKVHSSRPRKRALPVVVALINASKKTGNCVPGYRVPDNTPV